jgi:epoxyqueuosine reductase QueG
VEDQICNEIRRFALESPAGRFPESGKPYFDEPLIGFAAASDPLFADYKQLIGEFHQTPDQVLAGACGAEARAATVISWVLPITLETRESNRRESVFPSPAWARTRNFGEQFNAALRRHLVSWLEERGHLAVAPQLAAGWQEFSETPVGIASSWSERHAAYAAGLGTFSLNDALITPKGIAHRLGSVVTDLTLVPTPRPYPDHRHNCLYYREESCSMCVSRCPVGALSRAGGHDKAACSRYVYQTVVQAVAEEYGVTSTGCGLCQTKVPCEGGIPPSQR